MSVPCSWPNFLPELYLFHDGGPYQIETSPLIYSKNQLAGFYMIGSSVMIELKDPINVPRLVLMMLQSCQISLGRNMIILSNRKA